MSGAAADRPAPEAGGSSWSRQMRWTLAVISGLVAMVIVDATIVNVALPVIIRDLGVSSTQSQWVQATYTLVFAALLLTAGRVADRIGRRRMLVTGAGVFAVASLLAACAPNAPLLILGRAVQGIGGAMIFPAGLSILSATFRDHDRNIAFAVWGATIGGTAALGPLLGGWLATAFTWRAAFVLFVPVATVLAWVAVRTLTESVDPDARRGLDLPAAVLSALAAGLFVLALTEGRTWGWWTTRGEINVLGVPWAPAISPTPIALALAVACAVVLVGYTAGRAKAGRSTLVDPALFRISTFRNGNIVSAIVYLAEFGLLFSLPLWWQFVLGYSAAQAALALAPLAVASFLASGAAAGLAQRFGPLRAVRIGLTLEVIGAAGVGAVIAVDTPWWLPQGFLILYGFGLGIGAAQLGSVVLVDVPEARSGQGAGAATTSQQLGAALGVAVLGGVLFGTLAGNLSGRLIESGMPASDAQRIAERVQSSAGAAVSEFAATGATALADAARASLAVATRASVFTAAALLTVALATSMLLRRPANGGEPSSTANTGDAPKDSSGTPGC